jgi:hypothetical protein
VFVDVDHDPREVQVQWCASKFGYLKLLLSFDFSNSETQKARAGLDAQPGELSSSKLDDTTQIGCWRASGSTCKCDEELYFLSSFEEEPTLPPRKLVLCSISIDRTCKTHDRSFRSFPKNCFRVLTWPWFLLVA